MAPNLRTIKENMKRKKQLKLNWNDNKLVGRNRRTIFYRWGPTTDFGSLRGQRGTNNWHFSAKAFHWDNLEKKSNYSNLKWIKEIKRTQNPCQNVHCFTEQRRERKNGVQMAKENFEGFRFWEGNWRNWEQIAKLIKQKMNNDSTKMKLLNIC